MKIVVINGSPRKEGTVATLLKAVTADLQKDNEIEWINAGSLNMQFCKACMVCRKTDRCALPEDDAHSAGRKINEADALVIGTPTHWGNMSAPLKLLFDRNVPVFMGESAGGIPKPRQKGKKAIIITACSTAWPFNFILPESRGALNSVKEVLKYGGYKIVGTITRHGTKKSNVIVPSLKAKAVKIGSRLVH